MSDATELTTERSTSAVGSLQHTDPAGNGPDPSQQEPAPSRELRGQLGVFKLALTVLSVNAPVAVTSGFLTVIIGYGNGLGAPLSILLMGGLLVIFAVGFTTMGRLLPKAGAFYTYITAGLGRPIGLGASFVAFTAYIAAAAAGMPMLGIAVNQVVTEVFNGPLVDWRIYGLAGWALVSVFSYFNIELSARVLGVCLVAEVLFVVIFDAVVMANGGAHGLVGSSFTFEAFNSGSVAIGLLYAATIITGFETTAIFRDETRNPARTVPRATYLAVIGMAVMYAFTAWMIISAVGQKTVVADSAADPIGTFFSALEAYLGPFARDIVLVLLVTSILACTLGIQNVIARYFFSLSIDGVFPAKMGVAHKKHGSPHRAAVAAAALVLILGVSFFSADATTVYAGLVGFSGYCFLTLYTATSLAVVVYFWRKGWNRAQANVMQTIVAPILALIGLGSILVLATMNLDLLASSAEIGRIVWISILALVILGMGLAILLRRTKPDVYKRIGRQ